jgi:hypothetical protein
MARVFAGKTARGGTARSLARAASALIWGSLADIGEMLFISLLTAGIVAAVACALAGLVAWSFRAVCAACSPWKAATRSRTNQA